MKIQLVSGLLLFTLIAFATVTGHARTWTRQDGKTVEGDLISKSGDKATLKLLNGHEVAVSILDLILDDQQFIADWVPGEPKRPIEVPEEAVHFRGSWYLRVTEAKSWKLAAQYAEKKGGHLVWIRNEEEQNFVEGVADGIGVWLGATDEEVEGLWVWTNGEEVSYKNWGKDQPNNYKKRQNFLSMTPDGKWNDDFEEEVRVPAFIIQWD